MIARALQNNKLVTKIDLFDNYLKDESVKQIAHTMVRKRSLQHVNLGYNACNQRFVEQVTQIAKKNCERAKRMLVPKQVKEILRLSSKADQRVGLEEKIKEVEVKKSLA